MLFPLINQLLKPEVYQTDPAGMSETRVHAAQLLCKIFLHYLVLLSEWEGELDLWTRILDIMDRLMNSGQSDTLVEAVPESLKNVLLVMSSGDYLTPPSADGEEQTPQQRELWTETWTRIERFLPGLMPELFPDAAKEPKGPNQARSAVTESLPGAASPEPAQGSSQPDGRDDAESSGQVLASAVAEAEGQAV